MISSMHVTVKPFGPAVSAGAGATKQLEYLINLPPVDLTINDFIYIEVIRSR